MATKVEFTRVQTDAEVENINVKDGQLIYTGTGKMFMDYGTARKKLTSLIELLTVSDTAPEHCSTGDMYYNTTANLIYTATGTDTWGSTGATPSSKYLYVDLENSKLYYYDGTNFTSYGGGASNDVIISDTQPTEEDNKLWIDTGEVSSGGYENRYSTTEETIVGLWNGKPLYRKVFTGTFDGSGGGSSTSTYVHQILPSTCTIRNSCGNATQSGSGQNKRPFNFSFIYQGTTYYISCNFAKNSAYNYSWTMSLWYSAEYAGQTYEIAVEYTKDTN